MRSRRTMHGRRCRRSPLNQRSAVEQQLDIGAGVTVGTRKPISEPSASEPPNYTPKKEEIHNPMEQAGINLAQKDMNIKRDGRVTA